jgi:hypothetical protein
MKLNWRSHRPYVFSLAFCSLVGLFSGSNEPILPILVKTPIEPLLYSLHTGNQILFSLSVGYVTSFIFWILVVEIPEWTRRKIMREHLLSTYLSFKEDVLVNLLMASRGDYRYDLKDRLLDYKFFKQLYSENRNQNWYDVLNGLDERDDLLQDILLEMQLLVREFEYVMNNTRVDDEGLAAFFKRLCTHLLKLDSSQMYTHDQVKYLGNFLWEIFARFNFADGQRDYDIVEDMINRI